MQSSQYRFFSFTPVQYWIRCNARKLFSAQYVHKGTHFHQCIEAMSTGVDPVKSSSPDGIYVQVLPVIKPSTSESRNLIGNHSIQPSEAFTNRCKILLCKWNSGDFKDRYTGLIKSLPKKEYESVIKHHENGRLQEKHDLLLEFAKKLLPSPLHKMVGEIQLVGLLRFQDAPVYDEYVHLANLIVPHDNGDDDNTNIKKFFGEKVSFDDNSCYWFSWDKIPFQEMPADDELWYPKVLQQQEKVKGSFTFGGWSEKTIKSFELQTVQQIN